MPSNLLFLVKVLCPVGMKAEVQGGKRKARRWEDRGRKARRLNVERRVRRWNKDRKGTARGQGGCEGGTEGGSHEGKGGQSCVRWMEKCGTRSDGCK